MGRPLQQILTRFGQGASTPTRTARRWALGGVLCALVAIGPVPLATAAVALEASTGADAADVGVRRAYTVRRLPTAQWGMASPRGVAYVARDNALVVAGRERARTPFLRLSAYEDLLGTFAVAAAQPLTVVYDARVRHLTMAAGSDLVTVWPNRPFRARPQARVVAARLRLGRPSGATFDAAGNLLLLDAAAREIVRLDGTDPNRPAARIRLTGLGRATLRGLAYNPADGLRYVGSPGQRLVYAVDGRGRAVAAYRLPRSVANQQAFVFAPSADPTDDPARTSLYVADGGRRSGNDSRRNGGVVELSLTAMTAMATDPIAATLVQTIDTSGWNPPSPDPAGVTYLPAAGRLVLSDSEVEEMPNLYQGVNLFTSTVTGTLTATGVTTAFSKEPTGLDYRSSDGTLFVSDDTGTRRIFMVKPGGDGQHGTSDDSVTSFTTRPYSEDPEGVAYDPLSGHLFITDGLAREVFRVDPGADQQFGTSDDVWSNFDMDQYGAVDPEGIDHDPARDTLLVLDRKSKAVYEVTKAGALVRIVDVKAASPVAAAGVTLAPGSLQPERDNLYIVARGVDNGVDPEENDGKLYELAVPTSDFPPAVAITNPADGATVAGTITVAADASDDKGVAQVEFFDGTTSLGTDTTAADGWTAAWDTTTTADGTHTLRATATDTAGQTDSHTINVTVANTAPPPGSLEIPVSTSGDDVEERSNGRIWTNQSGLDMMTNVTSTGSDVQRAVGLRFTGVAVPRGATIVSAAVQFQVKKATSVTTDLVLTAQASDDAPAFTTTTYDVSSRPRTTASVAWSPPPWKKKGDRGADQRTADLSALLQEVVNRPGWASGNATVLVIEGAGERVAESFDGVFAPVLAIEYTS